MNFDTRHYKLKWDRKQNLSFQTPALKKYEVQHPCYSI